MEQNDLHKLSPVSQLVVIYQILREPVAHIPLAQLGERLAYSPQALSFEQEELKEAKLCDVRREGRMVFLDFGLRGKALWEKAERLMASPVRRTQWVRWGQPRARCRFWNYRVGPVVDARRGYYGDLRHARSGLGSRA
jgi:hypothetical protein